jgi:hypothetical protein
MLFPLKAVVAVAAVVRAKKPTEGPGQPYCSVSTDSQIAAAFHTVEQRRRLVPATSVTLLHNKLHKAECRHSLPFR